MSERKRGKTMFRQIGIALLFACALAVGLSAEAQDKPGGAVLTGDELQKLTEPSLLISGRHVLKVQVYFADLYVPGGASYALYTGSTGAGGPAKGKWRLDGDKFCRTHQFEGEQCVRFYRLADGSFEAWTLSGKQLVSRFTVVNKK
jgi:hypothetical protein